MRIALKALCSVPLVAVLAMMRITYKRSIPFRKAVPEMPELLQSRSLWVFNLSNYQVAGYDLVKRMQLLLLAIFVAWAIFYVGLVAS